jgi:hypothetical protein
MPLIRRELRSLPREPVLASLPVVTNVEHLVKETIVLPVILMAVTGIADQIGLLIYMRSALDRLVES